MATFVGLVMLTLFSVNGLAFTAMKGPPIAEKSDGKHIAKVGDNVKLSCPIQGYPTPMVTWARNGEVINYAWSRFRTNKKHMKIKGVVKEDTGVYFCKAINGFGNVEIKVELIVINPEDLNGISADQISRLSPPVFSARTKEAEKSKIQTVGSDLKLSCSASGFPEPTVHWYKDDQLYQNRGDLSIRSLQQRDSGAYSCVAQNIIGTISTTFDVSVRMSQSSPNVLFGPANISVEQGDSATLDCRVTTNYKPNIKWLKKLDVGHDTSDREVINVGSDHYRMIDNDNEIVPTGDGEFLSELVLTSASPQDEGMYICFVTSLKGGFNFKPSYLSVVKKSDTNSNEDFPLLILVICISIVTTLLIIGTVACLVQKKQKISPPSPESVQVQITPEKPIFKKQLTGTYEKPNFHLTSTRLEDLLTQSTPLNSPETSHDQPQFFLSNNYSEFSDPYGHPVYEVPTLQRTQYSYYEGARQNNSFNSSYSSRR
eukprot:TRINITY_DN60373_c0_g1_i1.p1 TRINITY_DN60373_c0_g1~~TRINITY_DN60373_c0_g1_i1.p1  ORF type:complete len:485 (-),score=93.30 TRINITY_DN60373_c0_g1_i1:118-1572(-)